MINSKNCLSLAMKKFPQSSGTQDSTVNLVRNFSRTSILERKVNLRKPRPYIYEKQLLIDICKPKYPPSVYWQLPAHEKCMRSASKKFLMERKGLNEENPYENILAKEIIDLFKESQMIAIVHRHSMLAEVLFEVRLAYKRVGMKLHDGYGRHTIGMAVKDTKYESIMPLFQISEAFITCPEAKVATLLKTLKKTPQITLMATIVDGRLLSKTETEMYASTNLATQQALVVQTINSVATSLTSNFKQHAQTLVQYLDQHAKSGGSEGGVTGGSESDQAATSGSEEVNSSPSSDKEAASTSTASSGIEEVVSSPSGSEGDKQATSSGSEEVAPGSSSDKEATSTSTKEDQASSPASGGETDKKDPA